MDAVTVAAPPGGELLGFVATVALVVFACAAVAASRAPRVLKLVLCAGLGLRVVGALARHTILFEVYGGQGDAVEYFRVAWGYAERYGALDFGPFFDSTIWRGTRWAGTHFIPFPTSVVLSLIGPSMLGAFVAFSLLAFGGLRAFVAAFREAYPLVPPDRYARWVYLFPSLWFWPSSIGKEAITLLGFGLVTAGYVGHRDRPRWILLAAGLLIVFAIRPQVAAVLALSCVLAEWLGLGGRLTMGRALQGLLMIVAGFAAIRYSLGAAGVESAGIEGVQSYMASDPSRRVAGGSSVEAAEVGAAGIPLALVNVFLRPFPWEARGLMQLVSSLEICGFWALVWLRRAHVVAAIRNWRTNRLVRFAIPVTLIYAAALGMMMSNMGIIARQRVFIFPFLFVLFEGGSRLASRSSRRPSVAEPAGDPIYEPSVLTAR
jgi:hypothetical protein